MGAAGEKVSGKPKLEPTERETGRDRRRQGRKVFILRHTHHHPANYNGFSGLGGLHPLGSHEWMLTGRGAGSTISREVK